MAASLGVILLSLPESRWREEAAAAAAESRRAAWSGRRGGGQGQGRERGAMWRLIFSPAFIFVGLFALMIVANRQGARFSVMPLYGRQKGFGPEELGLWISRDAFSASFLRRWRRGICRTASDGRRRFCRRLRCCCLGIGAFVWAGSLWQLLLSGVLLGMGEGLGSPAGTVFFADISPPGMEGVTIGLLRTFGGVGTIAGALALGAIADWASFAWALWVDAAILAASGIGADAAGAGDLPAAGRVGPGKAGVPGVPGGGRDAELASAGVCRRRRGHRRGRRPGRVRWITSGRDGGDDGDGGGAGGGRC